MENYITSGKALVASKRFRETGPPIFDTKDYRDHILAVSHIPICDDGIEHNADNVILAIAYNMWKLDKTEGAMKLFDSVLLAEYANAVSKTAPNMSLGNVLSAYLACTLAQRPVDVQKACDIANVLIAENCDASDDEEQVMIRCINNSETLVSRPIVEQYYECGRWRMYPYFASDLAFFLSNSIKRRKDGLRVYRWAYANTTYFTLHDMFCLMLLEYECNQELSISQSAWQGVVDFLGHKADTNWLLHMREMLDQNGTTASARIDALIRVLETFPDNKTFQKQESLVYKICLIVLQKTSHATPLQLAHIVKLENKNGVARRLATPVRQLQQRRELFDFPEDVWHIRNLGFLIYRLDASKIPPSTFYKEEHPLIKEIYRAEQLKNEDSQIALLQYDVSNVFSTDLLGILALYHARCGNLDILIDIWRHMKTTVFPQLLLKPLDVYDGLPSTDIIEEEECKDEELTAVVDARICALAYYLPCVLLTLQKKHQEAIAYCSALLQCELGGESKLIVRYALARNALEIKNHALFLEQRAFIEEHKRSLQGGRFMVPTLLQYLDDAAKSKEGIPLFI